MLQSVAIIVTSNTFEEIYFTSLGIFGKNVQMGKTSMTH